MRWTDRIVLFLCTGNYYRSRFAEMLFNAVAARHGLPWRADSRGLAIEFGVHNVGPVSRDTLRRLSTLGIPVAEALRYPRQVEETDLAEAGLIVALKEAEHRPLLRERYPAWVERVEYWHIHDIQDGTVEEALAGIEREVRSLLKRLQRDGSGTI